MAKHNVGIPRTQITKDRISVSQTGRISPMKGKHQTDDAKTRISIILQGRNLSNEHKTNLSIVLKGIPKSAEYRANMSKARKGIKTGRPPWNKDLTKEIDDRIKSSKGRKASQKTKNVMSESHMGHIVTQKTRDILRIKGKERCKEPEYLKKILHRRIPSYPEQIFIDLCKEFEYVGNGVLIIDGKNPDFVYITDEHKLVEIWGEYYKKGRNPQDLIDFYKVRGYQCLVIWASELKHQEQVVTKVRKFLKRGKKKERTLFRRRLD
jgi:hypothetical protein